MKATLRFLLGALLALAGSAFAQVDSGDGEAAVGSLTNHVLIRWPNSPFAFVRSGPTAVSGVYRQKEVPSSLPTPILTNKPKPADTGCDGFKDPEEIQAHLTDCYFIESDDNGLSDGVDFNTRGRDPKFGGAEGDEFLGGRNIYIWKPPLNDQYKTTMVADVSCYINLVFPLAHGEIGGEKYPIARHGYLREQYRRWSRVASYALIKQTGVQALIPID